MKKKWIHLAVTVLLVLEAVFLIAGRIVPRELERLLPKDFQPESGHVNDFEWAEGLDLSEVELHTLWEKLNALEYRYDGRVSGGVMVGEMYHLTFFQQEPPELVDLFVTKTRGVVYLNDKEYEMVGDTAALLEVLNNLR